jgi:hypothetical protein
MTLIPQENIAERRTGYRSDQPASVSSSRHRLFSVNWSTALGMTLFYIYMLIPARLQEIISIFSLNEPEVAKLYGVGYAYLPALDVVILAYVLLRQVFRKSRPKVKNWSVVTYVAASVLCGLLLWGRFALGAEHEMFWDGLLAALRLVAIYGLFTTIPGNAQLWGRRLQNGLALLIVTSLLLNFMGFANPDTPSNEAGRLNAAGLDFTTTSYLGWALVLSSITLSAGRRQALLIACGILGGFMGGARNATVLFLVCLVWLFFLQWRRMALLVSGLAIIPLTVAIWFPGVVSRLPAFRRTLDYDVFYQSQVMPNDAALQRFSFLKDLPLSDPAIVGRFNTWAGALELLGDLKGMPLGSDWYAQQELKPYGVPSHSHNAYLQALLKFSVLAIPIVIALWVSAWRGIRLHSPYGMTVMFLTASMFVDYWLLVIKATFLFFAFVGLNDSWIAQNRETSSAKRKRRFFKMRKLGLLKRKTRP